MKVQGGILLTKNQIDFAKLVESKRAAQASESLTRFRDERSFALAQAELAESKRAARARERFNEASLGESVRHNYATESQSASTLQETRRANLAAEQQRRDTLLEQQRSNKVSEGLRSLDIAEQSKRAAQSVSLGYSNLEESSRRNTLDHIYSQYQAENTRANVQNEQARIDEMIRHNKVLEQQEAKKIMLSGVSQTSKSIFDGLMTGIRLAGVL